MPGGIAVGPDGNLWFTEYNDNRIGRITPSGSVTEFLIPTAYSQPWTIAAGPDGNLWFTEHESGKIGRITPNGSDSTIAASIREFVIVTPTMLSAPWGIAAGQDGNMWFTVGVNNSLIGCITPGGTITEFATPTFLSDPMGIVAGPDGNLWFTEFDGNRIGRITQSGQIAEFPIPTVLSGAPSITAGPDGHIWFTERIGGIGRL